MSIKQLLSIFLLTFLLGCKSPEGVKYSFFVAGHTYGKPGRTELGLCNQFKSKFKLLNTTEKLKFGVLTGDIVRQRSDESWNAVDQDIEQINVPVHISRGNHDGSLEFFKKRYGNTYKSFKQEGDLHIILDSNIGEWNIIDEQLKFLKAQLSNSNDVKNIFIYVHNIIWWNESEYYAPYMNSRGRMSENLTFWADLALS